MRTTAALLLALALPAAAQTAPPADDRADWAQTAKGVRVLGGSAGLVRSGGTTTASFNPYVGRFVADGLALGVGLQLAHSSAGDSGRSVSQVGIGPRVTYVFGDPVGDALRPFVEADVQLSATRFGGDIQNDGWDASVGGGLAAGVQLPIARNVALSGQAFYRTVDVSFDPDFAFYGLSASFTTFIY